MRRDRKNQQKKKSGVYHKPLSIHRPRSGKKELIGVNDEYSSETAGVDEGTPPGGSTQAAECLDRVHREGLGKGE